MYLETYFVNLQCQMLISSCIFMEDNQKYQLVIETAHQLFWKFGIRRVTIEEIARESGVSKVTIYKFFKNKIEIAKTVINNILSNAEKEYKALMAKDIPFEEKIKSRLK